MCFNSETHFGYRLLVPPWGPPPAPLYANLFFAIHESRFVRKYPQIACCKQFIDDIIGIWVPVSDQDDDNKQWKAFKRDTNSYHGMVWEFMECTDVMNFMHLTITIREGKISTTLFEKLLNVHGYITPHFAHAPGFLNGLISGSTDRIYSLCSENRERKRHVSALCHRLLRRGYQPPDLLTKFARAHQLALEKRKPSADDPPPEKNQLDDTTIFFHSAYHPNNPSSALLQDKWPQTILDPSSQHILPRLTNMHAKPINFQRMVIAYRRPRNIGNLLSARNLHLSPGPQVSSYQTRNIEGLERARERDR